jgi:hypothetical protein
MGDGTAASEGKLRKMNGAKLLFCLGLALATAGAATLAGDTARPPTIYVAVDGTLAGVSSDELPAIFVSEMTKAPGSTWHFAPANPSGPPPPNRIEWHLKFDADASGTVRTYGFSRAMMARLIGSHRAVGLEARLYLNNTYQSLVYGGIKDGGDPRDPEIAAVVVELTRKLLSNADLNSASGQTRS